MSSFAETVHGGAELANQHVDRPLEGELASVEEAAGARLRAETDGDREAAGLAAEAIQAAATSAMSAGYSLSEIAQAEMRGKQHVRRDLHDDALEHVKQTGQDMREASIQHHRAIARAVRLGLSMREIAVAAGVTHGTIRAISNRLMGGEPGEDLDANDPDSAQPGTGLESSGAMIGTVPKVFERTRRTAGYEPPTGAD